MPGGPCGPAGPAGPAGIWPALKSTRSSDPFLTFADVTALVLSCRVPTDARGSAFSAASPTGVAPSTATTSAVADRTIGNRFLMTSPLCGVLGAESVIGQSVADREECHGNR